MPARKPKFDWSLLDRYALYDYFQQIKDQIVGQVLAPDEFHKIVSRHIKRQLPVRVAKKYDLAVQDNWVWVGGTYFSDYDERKQKCIQVDIVYNMLDEHINYNRARFNRFCITLSDVILHEIIHMRQYRRRGWKMLPDYASTAEKTEQRNQQSYYGCTDEIDAYAFNIACELLRRFKNDQTAVEHYLSITPNRRSIASHSLKNYLKAFNWDYDHPIIKRLKSRTIRYLPNAIIGKPYRNRDWINH